MKVKELIKELKKFNKDAEVKIIAHCKKEDFSFAWSNECGSESSSSIRDVKNEKLTADQVNLYVDSLCSNEKQSE